MRGGAVVGTRVAGSPRGGVSGDGGLRSVTLCVGQSCLGVGHLEMGPAVPCADQRQRRHEPQGCDRGTAEEGGLEPVG